MKRTPEPNSDQALIAAYLTEIERLYGTEVAQETVLVYTRGWFYLTLARRQWGWSTTAKYRRTKLEAMLATLRGRPAGA